MIVLAPALRGHSPRYLWSWRARVPGVVSRLHVNRKRAGNINKGLIPSDPRSFCSSYSELSILLSLRNILSYFYSF
jgi:hypothetical protein